MKPLTLIEKAFTLKQIPLFATLNLDLLLSIADKANSVIFEAHDYVFLAQEEANRMYFIVKGHVNLLSASGEAICSLKQGDFFGEESLFSNKPRSYAAFCPVDTLLLTLSRTNLYMIIAECPSVAISFLQIYTAALPYRPIKPLENAS